jgi:hypothetical protein
MRIICTGLIGQYPFGGVIWDYIQYVLGFRALGHDVWYLEDTGAWAYDPVAQQPSDDCSSNVASLRRIMEAFDLGDRWIYRNVADGSYHGVTDPVLAEKILSEADVLANISGACWLREPTVAICKKLFLDGDPMFTHICMMTDEKIAARIRQHDVHYSFGLNIGQPDCRVPTGGLHWIPTVQPVALDQWQGPEIKPSPLAKDAWTTVMNWSSYASKEFQGESYGQKDTEFLRFLDLPKLTGENFLLAVGQGPGRKRPTETLQAHGWQIIEPDEALPDHIAYRNFLAGAKAEWSIAKNGYVKSHSGWFSCRSACYLALGKPVVVQDTGWSRHLPAGEGMLTFSTLEEAASAIRDVSADYDRHARAARACAAEHFEAGKVLAKVLEQAGL